MPDPVLSPDLIPDTIWEPVRVGNETVLRGRPNYDKPGVAERVAQEALDAEWIARGGVRSTLDLILYNNQRSRL